MTHIGPESTKVETEVVVIDKITIGPEIGFIAGTTTKIIMEEEETTLVMEVVIETKDPITEIVVGLERETIIEVGIGTTIDQTTEGTIVTRGIVIEVQVRTTVGLEKGKETGVVQEKVSNPEVEINTIGDRVEIILETETIDLDLNQGQDQAPM